MPHELILGGQKSGKSRCAEQRAAAWLSQAQAQAHAALLIATALPGDAEMAQRINRHRADRAERLPALATLEVPRELPQAITRHSTPTRLIVVDCLTLWLTNLLMPVQGPALGEGVAATAREALCAALQAAPGPVLLVSNEVGLGVSPMTAEARHFVDELGVLHQAVAALCARVTLMVAGIECPIKGGRA